MKQNMTVLSPGRYLVPLVVITGEIENRVLTPLTVRPDESITATLANVLAAAAYHQGTPEDTTLFFPAFESVGGVYVYPDNEEAVPYSADDFSPLFFAYLDDNNLHAGDLPNYQDKIDAFFALCDAMTSDDA